MGLMLRLPLIVILAGVGALAMVVPGLYAHALDLHQAEDERVPAVCPQLAVRLQLTPERCARVLAVAEQGVQAAGEALGAG